MNDKWRILLVDVKFEKFLEATRQLGMYWLLLNAGPPSRSSR